MGPQQCKLKRIFQMEVASFEDGVLQRFCDALSFHWSVCCHLVEDRKHSNHSCFYYSTHLLSLQHIFLMQLSKLWKTVKIFKCKFPGIFNCEISPLGNFQTLMICRLAPMMRMKWGALQFVFACCVWCVVRRGPSGPVMLLFLSESLQRYPSIKLLCNALVWLVGQGFDSHSIYILNLPFGERLIS